MAIKIVRNAAGNCIHFRGTSNPVHFNACLSGQVDAVDSTLVNVVNDIQTAETGTTQYEFYNIPYTEFLDASGNVFADAQAVADYITANGNVAAPEDINVGYKGVFDASGGFDPETIANSIYDVNNAPVNGDWFFINVAGTIGSDVYVVNDIIKYSATADAWNQIKNAFATVEEIEASALNRYDIHVDGDYTGTIRNGSSVHPYIDLNTAISASTAGQSILIKGTITAPLSTGTAFTLPHSLYFYGADECVIKFATYNATNGDLFKFEGTDYSQEFSFNNITMMNAGGYGLLIKKASKVTVEDCTLTNNGWNGTGLSTVAAAAGGVLGYDSTASELQAFYAGSNASNGGAMRIEEAPQVLIVGNTVTKNLRGIRVQDCGVGGAGFVTRNQSTQNIESGLYLAVGSLGGCQNITVINNYSGYNANNGVLVIAGLNNKLSQNEINGNWSGGVVNWGSGNLTLRDCGLYDNNRSGFNGIGNVGDAKASIQINDAYSFLTTAFVANPAARFIMEVLDTQVHYTGVGSNTTKVGLLITSGMGSIPANEHNIINIDDVGFIGQDYAIDLSEVDITNMQLSVGDCRYQNIGIKAIRSPLAGKYSELPYSNHVTNVASVDVVVDTLKMSISLREGVGGNVINTYSANELQSVIRGTEVDIIQRASDKIQIRGLTLGNVYINGVVAGTNLSTLNDSLNAAFTMDLTEYKNFIETEVGVIGDDNATFYYIESPDGVFHYPLFKTEAEANAVDVELGGTAPGSSHTHTYADDTTGTTWYMPNTSNNMTDSDAPLNGLYIAPNGGEVESVVWNIQTTDADTNYVPTFTNITYNVQEGSAINVVYKAAGMTDTFNVTNVPAGYADNGFAIIGTAEDITNGAGNSVQHVINVTKANSFGSVQGTITINVLADLAGNEFTIVDQGGVIKFTQDGGLTVLDFNTVTFNAGSTYKFFVDDVTMQTNDVFDVVDANGATITSNDGLTQSGSGPGYAGTYFQYTIPTDVAPGKFLKFIDGATGTTYANVPMILAGSTYTANPTGITLEGPAANQTGSNVMDQYDHGWISLNEQLSAGERLVLDNAFFTDFFGEFMGTNNIFAIGLKGDNWTNTKEMNNATAASTGEFFKGNTYIVGTCTSGGSQVNMAIIAAGSQGNVMVLNTSSLREATCAFLEITGSGNNIRAAFGRNGNLSVTAGSESTTTYGNWNSYKGQTGEQGYGISSIDVVMSFWTYNGGDIDGGEIDWTGLTEISIPTPPTSSMTNFSKAVDFSSSTSEYLTMNSSDSRWPLLKLPSGAVAAHSTDPLKTSNGSGAEPFMTACVFQPGATAPSVQGTGGTRGGRIWACGQGYSIGHYNIMLEQHANNDIVFSWGKVGNYNGASSEENNIRVIENADPNKWYGVYIAHRGHRSSSPSAADLGTMFDIYVMSGDDSFAALSGNVSTAAEWGQSWNQTGKSITDSLTQTTTFHFGSYFGQSGTSFSGKIASFVVHPLHKDVDMPDAAEVKKVITDPVGWADDMINTSQVNYVGGGYTYTGANYTSALSTQIYLFGDGTNDSFTSIRNQAYPVDTSYTDLEFTNMNSSDIENVSIPGLT